MFGGAHNSCSPISEQHEDEGEPDPTVVPELGSPEAIAAIEDQLLNPASVGPFDPQMSPLQVLQHQRQWPTTAAVAGAATSDETSMHDDGRSEAEEEEEKHIIAPSPTPSPPRRRRKAQVTLPMAQGLNQGSHVHRINAGTAEVRGFTPDTLTPRQRITGSTLAAAFGMGRGTTAHPPGRLNSAALYVNPALPPLGTGSMLSSLAHRRSTSSRGSSFSSVQSSPYSLFNLHSPSQSTVPYINDRYMSDDGLSISSAASPRFGERGGRSGFNMIDTYSPAAANSSSSAADATPSRGSTPTASTRRRPRTVAEEDITQAQLEDRLFAMPSHIRAPVSAAGEPIAATSETRDDGRPRVRSDLVASPRTPFARMLVAILAQSVRTEAGYEADGGGNRFVQQDVVVGGAAVASLLKSMSMVGSFMPRPHARKPRVGEFFTLREFPRVSVLTAAPNAFSVDPVFPQQVILTLGGGAHSFQCTSQPVGTKDWAVTYHFVYVDACDADCSIGLTDLVPLCSKHKKSSSEPHGACVKSKGYEVQQILYHKRATDVAAASSAAAVASSCDWVQSAPHCYTVPCFGPPVVRATDSQKDALNQQRADERLKQANAAAAAAAGARANAAAKLGSGPAPRHRAAPKRRAVASQLGSGDEDDSTTAAHDCDATSSGGKRARLESCAPFSSSAASSAAVSCCSTPTASARRRPVPSFHSSLQSQTFQSATLNQRIMDQAAEEQSREQPRATREATLEEPQWSQQPAQMPILQDQLSAAQMEFRLEQLRDLFAVRRRHQQTAAHCEIVQQRRDGQMQDQEPHHPHAPLSPTSPLATDALPPSAALTPQRHPSDPR